MLLSFQLFRVDCVQIFGCNAAMILIYFNSIYSTNYICISFSYFSISKYILLPHSLQVEDLYTVEELLELASHGLDEISEDDWGEVEVAPSDDETDEGIDMSGSTSIFPDGLESLPYNVSDQLFKSDRTYNKSPRGIKLNGRNSETEVRQYNLQRGHEGSTDEFELAKIVADPLLFYLFMMSVDGSIYVKGFVNQPEEGKFNTGFVFASVTQSNPDLIFLIHKHVTGMADEIGKKEGTKVKVGNIYYVGGTYKNSSDRGQGFYHDGHSEHGFVVNDSLAVDGSGMRPLLIEILNKMRKVDPLRHKQALACLKFVAEKDATEERDIWQRLAYTDPGTVRDVAPHVKEIQDFNSTDLAVKCPARIAAFLDGVSDCIMGEANQDTFVSYLGALFASDGWTTFKFDEKTGVATMKVGIAIGRDNPAGARILKEILGMGTVASATSAEVPGMKDEHEKPYNSQAIVFTKPSDIVRFVGLLSGRSTKLYDPNTGKYFETKPSKLPHCVGKIFKPVVLLQYWHIFKDNGFESSNCIRFDMDQMKKIGAFRKDKSTGEKWHFDLFGFVKHLREKRGENIRVPNWEY